MCSDLRGKAFLNPLSGTIIFRRSSPYLIPQPEDECKALSILDHKNIIKLYKSYRKNEFLILHMEFVDGCTLDELQEERNVLTSDEIERIEKDLSAAVNHMTMNGISHNDLHLSNVMIDQEGTVKLIDFSCVSFLSETQIKEIGDTPSTDLKSVGVITDELRRLFKVARQ